MVACLRTKPSNTGTVDARPDPHSTATPVVRPEAKTDNDALLPKQIEGQWKVLNSNSAQCDRSETLDFTDSIIKTDVESKEDKFVFSTRLCQSFSIKSQSFTTPRCTGCDEIIFAY